jgi:MFS transporter, DHA3 family, macrolide efflux protein
MTAPQIQDEAGAGFNRFLPIAFNHFASSFATALVGFGLSVWVFQTTRSVSALSLLAICSLLPRAFSSVLAGAVVDRFGVRPAIVAGNLGALVSLAPCLLLFRQGRLELWHVCVSMTLAAACQSLLWPAISASVPVLVGKQDFVRANGLLQAVNATSGILAPAVGGLAALHFGTGTVLLISMVAFGVSVLPLAFRRIPVPPAEQSADEHSLERRANLSGITAAWTFLKRDATLLRLATVFAASSFVIALATVLLKPLVLSFGSAPALGTVMSVGSLGMLLGGLAITAVGKGAATFKQVMWLMAASGVCMALAGSRPALPLIAVATGAYFFIMAVVSSGVQTIIQSGVPLNLQGRMHATLATISLAAMPLAYPLAGPLADYVFEPLFAEGGPLAGNVGRFIGVGAGRGIGLLFIIMGGSIIAFSLLGQLRLRRRASGVEVLATSGQG